MAVSDSPSTPRVARRREAGFIVVGVATVVAATIGIAIAAVVLPTVSADEPSGERGRTVVDRPLDDVQLPTL